LSSSDNESRQSDNSTGVRKNTAKEISGKEQMSSRPHLQNLHTEFQTYSGGGVEEIKNSSVNCGAHTRPGGLVTFESLVSGDQSSPVTRARLPKAASKKVSPSVTEGDDNSNVLKR